MKPLLLTLALSLLLPPVVRLRANQSTDVRDKWRVANYSTGIYGMRSYEHFSFGVRDGKPEAFYSYRNADSELPLIYGGVKDCKGSPCFQISFPNGFVLYVRPRGKDLAISDSKGTYSKIFRWEYEGPVNGRGTFCASCAENEQEAIELIQAHYL